ncbi:MAG: Ppx/GppA phosphatase family protein [Corynebacterium sp.]|nr:Ppx/GppA phosphatase family protein [Corynebacterium sp.]
MSRAAIDCGTNAIRLLLVDDHGREICRLNRIVRLGEGVDETGRFLPTAIGRVEAALSDYVAIMKENGVTAHRMVATSATRDASNREDFFAMTERLLAKPAEVISGEEEAELSFRGATASLGDMANPVVIDLGGGSTEFVTKDAAYSTQMGCVRLTERFGLRTEAERAQARAYVREQLAIMQEHVDIQGISNVVGVAGTFTTIAALVLDLDSYDEERIHGAVLPFDGIRAVTQRLIHQTPAERAQDPRILHGREDVIGGGCIVIEEVMSLFEQEGIDSLTISIHDLLDGIITAL